MSLLFPVVSFTYISRILLAEGIGQINFAKSFTAYFAMLAVLGMKNYGIREGAKLRDNRDKFSKFAHEMLIINGITTMIAYVLFLICLIAIPRLHGYRELLLIFSASIVLSGMGMEWLYGALEEYKYITIRSICFQIIGLTGMFLFVRDKKDCYIYAVIYVFTTTGSYIMNFINSRKYINWKRYKNYQLIKHIKPILLLFMFTVSVTLYTSMDITMLGFISGDKAVGLYSAGEKANKLAVSLIVSLGVVLMPRISYYMEKGVEGKLTDLIEKAYHFIFMMSVPAFLGLYLLNDEIIFLLSGNTFQEAAVTMKLLAPIVLIIPINSLTDDQIFVPMRKDKLILYASGTGAIVNFISNMFLIPRFAQNGAAIGTVMAEGAVMCVCLYNANKELDMNTILKGYWKYWLAGLPILFIVPVVKNMFSQLIVVIGLSVLFSAAVYFGILYLLREKLVLEIVKKYVSH